MNVVIIDIITDKKYYIIFVFYFIQLPCLLFYLITMLRSVMLYSQGSILVKIKIRLSGLYYFTAVCS